MINKQKLKKILVIHNIITPTRTLFFNTLSEKCVREGYEFKIIFMNRTESNREWSTKIEESKMKFNYEVLGGKQFVSASKKDNHYFHMNFNIKTCLDNEKPDIIIHAGWAGISSWISLLWSKRNNGKFILWNESTKYENSWRRTITKPLVKCLVKNSDGYLSFGTRAKEYLEILGADKSKIQELYNTIDVDYFLSKYEELKKNRNKFKKKYGITTKYNLLFIGQFIDRKGIFELIYGFSKFQKHFPDISLTLVGNGPAKKILEKIIRDKGIKNVIFPGFIEQNKLGELYVTADIFTLPSSEEVWGYVINEAMCFGLPILTAHRVGSSVDLVSEGKNGYVMKDNTPEELCKGLNYIIENGLIENNNSLVKIQNFTINKTLNNLKL